jgi:hypothetical protein
MNQGVYVVGPYHGSVEDVSLAVPVSKRGENNITLGVGKENAGTAAPGQEISGSLPLPVR